MFAGKIFSAERMQFRVRSNMGGYSFNGGGMFPVFVGHGANLRSITTPDYIAFLIGLRMAVNSSVWVQTGATQPDPNPTFTASLEFGSIVGSVTKPEFFEVIVADFEIDDLAVYLNFNANWETHMGAMRWIVNGEIAGEWASQTVYSTMTPTPMSMPLVAQYMEFSGGGNAGFGNPTGIVIGANPSYSADAVATGGYRFLIDGEWEEWPVILPEPIVVSNDDGLDPTGALTATTTFNATIRSFANYSSNNFYVGPAPCNPSYRLFSLNATERTRGGSIVFVPNHDRGVFRMNDDYAEVIYRGGFPRTESSGSFTGFDSRSGLPGSVGDPRGGPSIYNQRSNREVHPPLTRFLATVQNEPHIIETAFDYPAYSICTLFDGVFKQREVPVSYPPDVTEVSTNYEDPCRFSYTYFGYRRSVSATFEFPYTLTRTGEILPYLTHFDPTYIGDRIWYFNTWASPGWSYVLWFPPEEASETVQWKIDGVPVTAQQYWLQIRQQLLDHPALPIGERLKYRNHIVAEPLWQNGLSGLMRDQVFGQFTSWWAISRFHADPILPIQSVAFDARSISAWFTEDATLAFGGSRVTVTPNPGVSRVEINIDIGRFSEYPFQLPHTANEITVGWIGNSIDSGYAMQVGADGSTVILTEIPGRFAKPRGKSTKYAGTWAHDYGVAYLNDAGVDFYQPAQKGLSAAFVGDPERAFSFGLLPARGMNALRFVFNVDDADSFTVDYPVFHNRWIASDLQFIREAAYFTSVLTPNGPWWRYGVWTFYNIIFGFLDPPSVAVAEGMPTVLDWLATKRIAFLGRSPFDLIYEETATLYDHGIEWTQTKHLAADPFQQTALTHSFIVKGLSRMVGIMVNSYSECPPLPIFPGRARDGNFAKLRGASMRAYSLASTKQWLVHPGEPTDPVNELIEPGGGDVLTVSPPCAGWIGGYHLEQTDGSEQIDWLVRLAQNDHAIDWAKVRPWHGYVWVPGDESAAKRLFAIRMCRDEHLGFLHAVIPVNPGVKLRSWNETKGVDRTRDVTSDPAQMAGIAWSQETREIVVVYCHIQPDDSTIIKRTTTDSQGITWSEPEMLWAGIGADDAFDRIGREFVSYWNDGAFRVRYRRNLNQPWQGPFTVATSTEGTTAIEIGPFADSPVIVVTAVALETGELQIRRYESTSSGRTWRETT